MIELAHVIILKIKGKKLKTTLVFLIITVFFGVSSVADEGREIYDSMKKLKGEWVLSDLQKQEGKAKKDKLVLSLISAGATGMHFKLIGRSSTVQEILLPTTKKEMMSMYHCKDEWCEDVKATHYCVKQNQPELLADEDSTENVIIYNCDMTTELCQSDADHVHKIKHEISDDGKHLKTTYTSWKYGEYLDDLIYHFDRK